MLISSQHRPTNSKTKETDHFAALYSFLPQLYMDITLSLFSLVVTEARKILFLKKNTFFHVSLDLQILWL